MTCNRPAERAMALLIAAVPAFIGCGSAMPQVSGIVTLDGKPLTHGTVTFVSEGKPTAASKIQSDGTYQLKTGDAVGVTEGRYRITVSAYQTKPSTDGSGEPIPILATPAKYNRVESTDLIRDVVSGKNSIDLDLVTHP